MKRESATAFTGFLLERFHDDRVLADASARRADGYGASRSGAIPRPGREPNVSRWETTARRSFSIARFFETARAYRFFWTREVFFVFSFPNHPERARSQKDETDVSRTEHT